MRSRGSFLSAMGLLAKYHDRRGAKNRKAAFSRRTNLFGCAC